MALTDNINDYKLLLGEIQFTITKNDSLFKQIQQSNYPNAGSYTSDLLNYKIDTQIENLTEARTQIWNFLNKKYTENTKLRTYYFDEIRKVDEHINELTKQKKILIESIQSKKNKSSTADQSIKHHKYIFNKMEYYLFLYKVLVILQIVILAIITLCFLGTIPRASCLIMVIIILIATLAFVGYYVFMVNIGRSFFNWNKFEYNNDSVKKTKLSINSLSVSTADKEKEIADKSVDEIIKKSKSSAGSCDIQPHTTKML